MKPVLVCTVVAESLFWTVGNACPCVAGSIGLPQSEVTTQRAVTIEFLLDGIYQHKRCARVSGCVRFVLVIASAVGSPAEDIIISSSTVSSNLLHGALIENPRSFVKVARSQFKDNDYGAGLRIRGGACDVDIRDTTIEGNSNSGLNITYRLDDS